MSKRHEQLLFHYSSALERGDFDAVADVLREAEHDPALEQMILDMNDAYAVERFNHTNPKENPMLAALYQNPYRTQRSRVHWQSLPFVAALAVIALLSVMLAVETRGSTPLNTGGDNSTAVAQTSPYCSGVLVSTFTTLPLRSRPALDAPVVTELVHERNAGREIVVQDRVSVDGEAWVFVRVPSSPDVPFGWITEAEFRTMVADCQPLVDGIAQRPLLVATVDMNATIIPPVITSTPLPVMPQQPLFVVTQPSADAFVTVVPANAIPLSTFTATPVPFVIEPSQLPPTIVPPADMRGQITPDPASMTRACRATTLTTADVLDFPGYPSHLKTTVLRNTEVVVGIYTVSSDSQGHGQLWYFVDADGVQGWMLAYLLDASACPPIPDVLAAPPATQLAETQLYMTATAMIQTATALPPTVVPPAQDAATAEQFMPVYVQPGDTLISVLRRFNISLDRIPELMRINNLTDNSFVTGSAELPPGMILLVPIPNLESLLTCTLQAGEQVNVLTEDAEDAEVVMTLQAGDSLDVFTEPIGDWYAAVVHYDSAIMSNVYVRIDAVESLAGCQRVTTGETSSADALAAPAPFSAEPTVIPPVLVPVTSTPIPTPTLVR
ncbi:MAG: LysM domain-containing protein [Anaerolineae bacterium]